MLSGPSSTAALLTNAISPALAAPYAACRGAALVPDTEATNVIVPPPLALMSGAAYCIASQPWRRYMSKCQSHSSSVISVSSLYCAMPTMSTKPSSLPPKILPASSNSRLHAVALGHVADPGHRVVADLGRDVVGPLLVDVDAEDPRAVLHQRMRRLTPHTLAGSDHHIGAAIEAQHVGKIGYR